MRNDSTLALLAVACLLAVLTGCVERKITIASDPPGALVYVNDAEKGRTPVTFPFTWYGEYDVRLRLERNEGTPEEPKMVQYYLHTSKAAKAPVYEWLGVDLFAELLPVHFKDEKIWAFAVPKVAEKSDAELIGAAKELQKRVAEKAALEPTTQEKGKGGK